MRLKRKSNGQRITLSPTSILGRGGEACVYAIPQDSSVVAKIYHQPLDNRAKKLAAMLANPPYDPLALEGHVSIAWPIDTIVDSRNCVVGFLMPRVREMSPIFDYYNPAARRQHCPLFNYIYLHRTAHNLAAAMRSLHERGYVIGDVNESNILVADTALVTLVDTDSFQVRDGRNTYRCPVGKPEFTPPELQDQTFNQIDRLPEHDLFGLAILIFQLLMEGTHPFAGVFIGQGEPPAIEKRIALGHFPYGVRRVPYRPTPTAPSFDILHPTLQELFVRCFDRGHRNPLERPDALTWQNAIDEAEQALVTCPANEQHRYSDRLKACPWCDRTLRLGGRDPFPSQQAVQRGLHLKPIPTKPTPLPATRLTMRSQMPSAMLPTRNYAMPTYIQLIPTFTLNFGRFGIKKLVKFRRHLVAFGAVLLLAGAAAQIYGYFRYGLVPTSPVFLIKSLSSNSFLEKTMLSNSGQVTAVAFSPDGQIIASNGGDRNIRLWRRDTGAAIPISINASETIESIAIGPVDQIVTGSSDGTVALWNYSTGKLLLTLKGHAGLVKSVAFSPDGRSIASGSYDRTIKLWNIATGKEERTFYGQPFVITSVAFSPDGRLLAGSNNRGEIAFWDTTSGRLLRNLPGDSDWVNSIAFSPDGNALASASSDGTIELWSRRTGNLIVTFEDRAVGVDALAFSPNGEMLASGSNDGTVRLWDLSSGQAIRTLVGHRGSVQSVVFSPDGNAIATGGIDGTVKLWRVGDR